MVAKTNKQPCKWISSASCDGGITRYSLRTAKRIEESTNLNFFTINELMQLPQLAFVEISAYAVELVRTGAFYLCVYFYRLTPRQESGGHDEPNRRDVPAAHDENLNPDQNRMRKFDPVE